uniref:Uncharacterized protein n=1 Tax=Haptolina brevifila TaxID=156173 RepID=A0A7S2NB94_9EUKA|mmetsp:Transcript_72380/g.143726  ORF Transcript_72380/g.143726 Transcript_72380/m.143726 type:complete len:137 (+) Transcript_72380:712-1122(+)
MAQLVDGGFVARFWPQLEYWLSLRAASASGLVLDPSRARSTVRILPGEPPFLQTLLTELWSGKDAKEASAALLADHVPLCKPADRQVQLEAVGRLDGWLRSHTAQVESWRRLRSLEAEAATTATRRKADVVMGELV